ncbi:MAG: arsenite methyltransferase [Deltaproteobacteria bacterium]|nr:arsenite methyltransferase [Deltaproteobacteria bacterium]
MESAGDLKKLVKEKYSEIAKAEGCGSGCCCGVEETTASDYTIFAEDYAKLKGYNPDADLKLGCGVPTEFAKIKSGDVVIDLGSGAGNDAFVARALTGASGKVIGIDMTEAMIEKARRNADKLEFSNVEFRLGEIEDMPLPEATADVVISNCVLNLVPDKQRAFAEILRVLKPGGHFSISDVVLARALPEGLRKAAEMYAGCVSGALLREDYLNLISRQGFSNILIQAEKALSIPDDVLGKYLSAAEIAEFKSSGAAILSLTVYAEKPLRG